MADKEEENKLKNFYKEIPEQQLLDLLSEGEKGFKEAAYTLLVEEAKRRGLEDKLNEIKINKVKNLAEEKGEKELKEYEVKGYKLTCPVCGNKSFSTRRSLLNTRGLTFLEWDWANKAADNYICGKCGYIMWFLQD